jgi:hypothetical protein
MPLFVENMYYGIFFSLFVLWLFILASYGAGNLLNHYVLKLHFRRTFTGAIISVALGFNLLALITLIMGTLKLLNPVSIWILLGLFASSGCLNINALAKAKIIFFRKNVIFSTALIIVAIFTLGSALCVPYIWDELTYHIALPYRWIKAGSLAVFEDNAFSGFPALPQLLFRLGCQNGGILFPRLLVWASYLSLFTAIYIYLRAYANRFIVLIMTFMFITSPLLINMMRSTYVEVFIMLNMLTALLLIRETKNSWKTIFVCGMLSGGIVATKLTGIGIAAIIFIFLWFKYQKSFAAKRSSLFIYFALGGICMALPFYLRPWLLTGNPFYPFLASWFGGCEADILVSKYHYLMANTHFGLRSVLGFFTVFILIAFDGSSFDGIILGWTFIAFALLGVWWLRNLRDEEKVFWRVKIYLPTAIIFYYVFWFMTSQQTRFLQPLLFLVLLTAIHGIRTLEMKSQKNTIVILMLIWIGCFLYPPVKGYSLGSSNWLAVRHFTLAWRSMQYFPKCSVEFLKFAVRDPGYIESMTALAAKTPPDSKVMLLYERRGLYCPRPYVIGTPYWQVKYNTPVAESPEEFYNSLIKDNIQYIILGGSTRNPDEIGGEYLKKKEQLMNQINYLVSNKKLSVIWGQGNYFLCKVL